jgi:hypothetical protein
MEREFAVRSIKLCSVALTAILLATPACSGNTDSVPPQTTVADLTTSLSGAAAATSCDLDTVPHSIDRLIAALNAGDASGADAAVAAEPRFQWFSVDPERLSMTAASDRSTLRSFLDGKIASSVQYEVADLDVASDRGSDRSRSFNFEMIERIDGQPPTHARSKGAIDCDTGLIMVLSVGTRET